MRILYGNQCAFDVGGKNTKPLRAHKKHCNFYFWKKRLDTLNTYLFYIEAAEGKMKKEVISERQGIVLIILYVIGSTLLIGAGGQAKQDTWIAVIIAIIWASALVLMFSRILSLYPGKDLFDILQIVMGKFMGKLISIIMIWYAFHLGALIMRNLSELTNVSVFPDTPVIVPMVFFTILLIWGVKAGLEVIGRWSEFFVWIVVTLFIVITCLSMTQMNIDNLKPILSDGVFPVLRGAFSAFSFPFGETVVFMMVFSNIAKVKNYNKTFLLGLIIGGAIVFIATIRNLLILGVYLISTYYFPSFISISLIHLGQLLQRLEISVVIVFLICTYIKTIICLFAVCKGISKLFSLNDYGFIATPIALLMLCFSFVVYKNTMEMSDWAFEVYPYYSFIFEVILPFIVFVLVEFRHRTHLK